MKNLLFKFCLLILTLIQVVLAINARQACRPHQCHKPRKSLTSSRKNRRSIWVTPLLSIFSAISVWLECRRREADCSARNRHP